MFKQNCLSYLPSFFCIILYLTVINLGKQNFSCFHMPVRISADADSFPVFVLDTHHCQQSRSVAVKIWSCIKPEFSLIPPVSYSNRNLIIFFQEFRNIISLILQSVMIRCPARSHEQVSCFPSVNKCLIYTTGGRIQPCSLHRSVQRKAADKYRTCSLFSRKCMGNPFCIPVFFSHQTGFKVSCHLSQLSVIIPYTDLHLINSHLFQCSTLIWHQNGLVAFHPAAVPHKPASADNLNLVVCLHNILLFTLQLP